MKDVEKDITYGSLWAYPQANYGPTFTHIR